MYIVYCSSITNTSRYFIQYNYKGYVTNVISTLLHVV